jgi:hypothetical protein
VGVVAALGALVLASRLWLMHTWGTPVPYWDQWDAEGALYRAWLTGSLDWRLLFQPHNEHRIVLTRLADLALLEACGRWSPWAQLGLNAALHAATATLLAGCFWPALSPRARLGWMAGLAVLFCSAAGWQNALWGFQSQVYFSNLLGLGGIALLALTPPWQARWWLGGVALGLGLLGNAGGALAAVAAAIGALPTQRSARSWLPFLVISAVAALGFALQVSVPHHAALRAQDPGQFLGVLARALSWPFVDSAWLWVVVQFPLVWLWISRRHQGQALAPAERCALALAAYAALHAAAIAYSRGAGLPELRPLSRYQDPLHLGLAVQFFGVLRLVSGHGRPVRLLAAGWSAAALVGLVLLSLQAFLYHLPIKRAQDQKGLEQVRAYLQTRDPQALPPPAPFASPHPDPTAIMRVLDDPILQPVLPREIVQQTPAPLVLRAASGITLVTALALGLSILAELRRNSPRPQVRSTGERAPST